MGSEAAAKMDQATAELAGADSLAHIPAVGDAAPTFALPNEVGEIVSLDGLLASGPAVLAFYRGVWCPFCSLTLRAYQPHLPALRASGASMVAISLQTPDASLSTAAGNGLSYPVLSDVGGAVSRDYGLVFQLPGYLQDVYRQLGHPLPTFNGTNDWALPVPAVFVIDKSGVVRFGKALLDYTQRTDPLEVVDVVAHL
ncbi:hypothetical protein A9W95_23015 [Mycobacterium sp. 1423905.2]|nr:hypothetical protein A9W95_23015 [Mycobacterium sp. 1423905.2]